MLNGYNANDLHPEVLAMYDPERFDPDNLFGRKKKKAAGQPVGKEKRKMKRAERKGAKERQLEARKAIATVQAIADTDGVAPEIVSEKIAAANVDEMKNFIQSRGQQPVSDNPAALAAQTAMIHEDAIQNVMDAGITPDYDVAEQTVFEEYIDGEEVGEADEFAPAILGSIAAAAKGAIAKINAKRAAKGQKPLFSGNKAKNLAAKINKAVSVKGTDEGVNVVIKAVKDEAKSDKDKADLQIVIDEAIAQAEKQKKAEYMKKYLPYAIIAIVVIFLIGKSFGK